MYPRGRSVTDKQDELCVTLGYRSTPRTDTGYRIKEIVMHPCALAASRDLSLGRNKSPLG